MRGWWIDKDGNDAPADYQGRVWWLPCPNCGGQAIDHCCSGDQAQPEPELGTETVSVRRRLSPGPYRLV
jgi:hypothetical protein